MNTQRDIFNNPTATQQPAPQPDKPPARQSGVMSEAQWQQWMGRVADRMRRMNQERASHERP